MYSDLRSLSVYSWNYKECEINKKKGGSRVMDQAHCALCRRFLIASDSFMKGWLLYRGEKRNSQWLHRSAVAVCQLTVIQRPAAPILCRVTRRCAPGLANKFNFTLSAAAPAGALSPRSRWAPRGESLKSGHTTPRRCGPQRNTISSNQPDGGECPLTVSLNHKILQGGGIISSVPH